MVMGLAGCASTGPEQCVPPEIDVIPTQLTSADIDKLREAPRANDEREATARAYLLDHCDSVESFGIPGSRQRTHQCVIKGKSTERIVIGAHYDKRGRGAGVADNWAGVVLLARLLGEMKSARPNYTLAFVMFGEEEPGMVGSTAYLRAQEDAGNIVAMINLDTFGTGPVTIDRRSYYPLECVTAAVAEAVGIEYRTSYLTETVGDWLPFSDQGIAVLNLNSLDRRGLRLIHTSRDRFENIDINRLQETWMLVLNLARSVDRDLAEILRQR